MSHCGRTLSVLFVSLMSIGSAAAARAQAVDSLWTIRGGSYAGETMAIDLRAATQRGSRFWRLSGLRGEPRIIGWNPSRLPVAVAFRHDGSIGEADSAAFWAILRRMEDDMGMRLFEPVALESGADPDDVIVVEVRPTVRGEGMTLLTWSMYGSLYDARVLLRSTATLLDGRVVTHEMMHALGFGHTMAWHSVMNPAVTLNARLSREDVAYAQAAIASRAVSERADMWERLALAASREQRAPLEDGVCEIFDFPLKSRAGCTSFPCFRSSASCRAAQSTAPSPER